MGAITHGGGGTEWMVEAGILPDRVTTGWCPADGEPYPMPHTDELIVFEDYF